MSNFQDGYFKFIPSFVAETPILFPWVNGARVVLLLVFIIGFTGTYKSLKAVYGKEIEQNKVLIRK
ncbi:MAG: Na+dependent transporter, partial [Clostridiaceae bacterium]|nr:Na+dependent transporter [Clostridiaceae bacterium]